MTTLTVSRRPAPADPIATAPGRGGATVTAVRITADHAVYVVCSRHGLVLADTYGPQAGLAEIRAACRGANVRTHAHAMFCTADRCSRTLTAATREKR